MTQIRSPLILGAIVALALLACIGFARNDSGSPVTQPLTAIAHSDAVYGLGATIDQLPMYQATHVLGIGPVLTQSIALCGIGVAAVIDQTTLGSSPPIVTAMMVVFFAYGALYCVQRTRAPEYVHRNRFWRRLLAKMDHGRARLSTTCTEGQVRQKVYLTLSLLATLAIILAITGVVSPLLATIFGFAITGVTICYMNWTQVGLAASDSGDSGGINFLRRYVQGHGPELTIATLAAFGIMAAALLTTGMSTLSILTVAIGVMGLYSWTQLHGVDNDRAKTSALPLYIIVAASVLGAPTLTMMIVASLGATAATFYGIVQHHRGCTWLDGCSNFGLIVTLRHFTDHVLGSGGPVHESPPVGASLASGGVLVISTERPVEQYGGADPDPTTIFGTPTRGRPGNPQTPRPAGLTRTFGTAVTT